MYLKTLILNCLKLVVQEGEELSEDSISTYKNDDSYSNYINNSIGAINRALIRASQEKALKSKRFSITTSTDYESNTSVSTEYSISELIDDCSSIREVINATTLEKADYQVSGDTLIIYKDEIYSNANVYIHTSNGDVEASSTIGSYTIYYSPVAPNFTLDNDLNIDLSTYGISDSLANMIPYFVASEVMQDDNQSLAIQYLNRFEGYLAQFNKETTKRVQNRVRNALKW